MKKYLITFSMSLILSNITFSQSIQKPKEVVETDKIEVAQATNTHDLVCKMKLGKSHTITAINGQKQYRFCSEVCKKKFVKSPEKYLEK